jgi:preprotein translocase subunit SecA
MRIFGGEQISKLMTTLKMPEDVPLEHPMVSKAIEQAQVKVESFHFDSRKHLVEYDDVMNKQREIIYKKRLQVLKWFENEKEKKRLTNKVTDILDAESQALVTLQINPETEAINYDNLLTELNTIVPFDPASQKRVKKQLENITNSDQMQDAVSEIIAKTYQQRTKQIGEPLMHEIEKFVMLMTIDNLWIDHLDAIDDLRDGIGLRGYAQRDPLVEYKSEAFTSFEKLIASIDYEVARRVFRIQVAQSAQAQTPLAQAEEVKPEAPKIDKAEKVEAAPITKPTSDFASAFAKVGANRSHNKPAPGEKKQKIGRNDPCWCNSGKKFKKCHYPDQGN